jgi:hypothetical protein
VIKQLERAGGGRGGQVVASRVIDVDVVPCAASPAESTVQRESIVRASIGSRVIGHAVSPAHAGKRPWRNDTRLGPRATTNDAS